jgi:1-acylglycerone phosphate reductase
MKSVLVTGCSDGGIGSALAQSFAQRGLLVFAAARNVTKMPKLANLPNVRLLTLDITKPEDVRAATAAVKKETGGSLDYLINNAAQTRYMPLLDEDPEFEQAKELFELNVWSQLRMVQAFAPLLIEAKGTVVYISAVSGRLNFPWIGAQSNFLFSLKQSLKIVATNILVKECTLLPNAPQKSSSMLYAMNSRLLE